MVRGLKYEIAVSETTDETECKDIYDLPVSSGLAPPSIGASSLSDAGATHNEVVSTVPEVGSVGSGRSMEDSTFGMDAYLERYANESTTIGSERQGVLKSVDETISNGSRISPYDTSATGHLSNAPSEGRKYAATEGGTPPQSLKLPDVMEVSEAAPSYPITASVRKSRARSSIFNFFCCVSHEARTESTDL